MQPLPPLVLIPGNLCDERLWTHVLQRLSRLADCRTVSWGVDESSASAAAERILEEAPASFALAGMSMGGSVALEICAQAPHRVERLALISCQPRGDSKAGAKARSDLLSYANAYGMSALVKDRLWSSYVHTKRQADQQLLDTVVAMAECAGVQAYEAQHKLLASRRDHAVTLASLSVPVAVISGDSDLLCTPAQHDEMMALARFGRRTEVPDCGHMSPLEDPVAVANSLASWMVPASVG